MAQRLYPLQALLSVRHYREEAARNALRLEERRLVQAREEVGRRQAELERYRVWRQEEEPEAGGHGGHAGEHAGEHAGLSWGRWKNGVRKKREARCRKGGRAPWMEKRRPRAENARGKAHGGAWGIPKKNTAEGPRGVRRPGFRIRNDAGFPCRTQGRPGKGAGQDALRHGRRITAGRGKKLPLCPGSGGRGTGCGECAAALRGWRNTGCRQKTHAEKRTAGRGDNAGGKRARIRKSAA